MKVRIGTRKSQLALIQADLVKSAIQALNLGLEVEIVPLVTPGDRKQGTALAAKGDKRDWIEDLEIALVRNEIDIAVHSSKDVPRDISTETILLPVLKREDPRDIFIGKLINNKRIKFADLDADSVLGTASFRRRAELLRIKPQIKVISHRGNVPTRVEKLEKSDELSGIILAQAGIERLKISGLDYEQIDTDLMLPAINQGIIAAQAREEDKNILSLIEQIQDSKTVVEFDAERGCIEVVPADCDSAIGIHARVDGEIVKITSRVLSLDGQTSISSQCEGPSEEAFELGVELGELLMEMGAGAILEESRGEKGTLPF